MARTRRRPENSKPPAPGRERPPRPGKRRHGRTGRLAGLLRGMSGWTGSCVLHSVILLVLTLLYVPRHVTALTVEAIIVTPQTALQKQEFYREVKHQKLFWRVDKGDSVNDVESVKMPLNEDAVRPVDEDQQLVEEPSLGKEPKPNSKLPREDLLPPMHLTSGTRDGRAYSEDIPGLTPKPRAEWAVRSGDQMIGAPRSHKNLSVFVISGQQGDGGRKILTLREAMEQKKVVVHETGDVNQLHIENCSPNEHIFIQAGDMVKGGKQDRVLAVDMLLAPRSGKKTASAFCVESGRWSQRAGEDAGRFSSSKFILATKGLKVAASHKQDQAEVWAYVAQAQKKLAEKLGTSVKDTRSDSSLQLTLENPKVRAAVREYVAKLRPLIEKNPKAVGLAFAVGGKMSGADVYSSPQLFRKLWPKLLEAAVIEALAAEKKRRGGGKITQYDVKKWFQEMEKARVNRRKHSPAGTTLTKESRTSLMLETHEPQRGKWIHRSYIAKDKPSKPAPPLPGDRAARTWSRPPESKTKVITRVIRRGDTTIMYLEGRPKEEK